MLKESIAVLMFAGLSASALADDLLVPSQYQTIQAAIDAAADGDQIIIAAGTYRELLDTLGKAVTLRSLDPSSPSVVAETVLSGDLDANGSPDGTVITCNSGETMLTRIEGVTIRDGSAPAGGGVLVDQAAITIDRCIFTANVSTDSLQGGGAIAILSGSLMLTGCAFDGNATSRRGVDLYSIDADIDLVGCTFDATAPDIGEFSIYHRESGSINFTNSHFRDRTGSLLVSNSLAAVTISGCSFERGAGGSIDMAVDTALVQDSIFRDNELSGIANSFSSLGIRGNSIRVEDCVFESNNIPENRSEFGAGLHISGSEGIVRNCDFVGNTALGGFGSAMAPGCQSTTIENCFFGDNIARHGAIDIVNFNTNVYIRACTFISNISENGGAIFSHDAKGTVEACYFGHNRATGDGSSNSGDGGAVYIDGRAREALCFRDCTFVSNSATADGGAFFATGNRSRIFGRASLDRCSFYGNSAQDSGGAVILSGAAPKPVSHCIFVDNIAGISGGALLQWNTDVLQSVFVNNQAPSGLSMQIGDAGEIAKTSNCIYVGDGTAPHLVDDSDPDDAFTVDHCIVTGGHTGPGAGSHIYDVDPLFVRMPSDGGDGWGDDPATTDTDESLNDDFGDLRLSANSWGIDAGDNNAVPADVFDLDGDDDLDEPVPFDFNDAPRFADDTGIPDVGVGPAPVVDIGAFEFQGTSCLPDVNSDGSATPTDFTAWINAFNNNLPECDQDRDGFCTPKDFTAWAANFNAGCG